MEGLTREMLEMSHMAHTLGTNTAQLRENFQMFARAGVPMEHAHKALQGIAETFVDLQMMNSQTVPKLMQANLIPVQQMHAQVLEMRKAQDPDQLADAIRRGAHAVREYNTARYGAAVGAAEEQRYLAMLKAQGIEFTENARKVSDWQKQLEKERDTRSKEFQKTSADTSDNYKAISRSLGSILRDTLTSTGAAEGWEKFTRRIREDIEKTELAMRNMNTPQMRAASERAREKVATPGQTGPLTNQERGLPAQESMSPAAQERWRRRGGRRGPAGTTGETAPFGDRFGDWGAQRFMGGGDETGPHGPYSPVTGGLAGGGIMAGSPLSDNLEDRRLENENTRKTEDNTAELKRLNEMLVFSQQGAAVGGGLAGQLGLGDIGKGGGGAPAGGGAPSMSGWTGGAGRSRAPGGAISTGGATTTGDAGSTGMPVIAGAGGVPGEILKRAQEVALQGGPGAVDQFMRSQGYPKNGAWCGQFAASVVKSTGGTPPANPQVASNWRNWGTKVDVPQPGDVAVRRGPATGSTGSHVTFVQSVGQGTFAGLGGNQSNQAKVSQFATGRFDFFRGQGSQGDPNATPQTQGGQTAQTAGGAQPGVDYTQSANQQATYRFNNPGGMYPGRAAQMFGTTGTGVIGGGHKIAGFPTPIHGAAANMQNLAMGYVGMTVGGAMRKWSGGSRAVTGPSGNVFNQNQVITREMTQDPGFMIPFMQSLASGEAQGKYPITQQGWQKAFQWYQQGRPGSGAGAAMPGNAQLTQGQLGPGGIPNMGTMGGVPVIVQSLTPNASQQLIEAQRTNNANLASTAANATAAAIKAGATPEQAAAAGAAAATTAHGVAPKPADVTGKPDPERQKQEQRAAEDARRDTEDERRQAEITRYQRQADRAQIRKEERAMTPEQRAQARQARKEQEEEEKHTREGEKLQRTAERRDERAQRRQAAADRRLQERAEGERDPAGRNRPLRRQTKSQRTGQKPWSRMTPQEKADTLRDQQIEADRVRKEEEERRVAEDAAAQRLKDSRKSIEEIEEDAQRRLDPEGYLDRELREQREREGKTPLEEADERREARERKRDSTTGFSATGKALDASGKALDAASGDTVKVQADGTLKVDVRAAKGTSVAAKGEGAFKKTTVERSTQMEPAKSGPDDSPAQGFD